MNFEWLLFLLPWLALLACPVLMFWMMRGMHGGSCGKETATTGDGTLATAAADPRSGDVSTEITQLKQRLARLEEQRATMAVDAYR